MDERVLEPLEGPPGDFLVVGAMLGWRKGGEGRGRGRGGRRKGRRAAGEEKLSGGRKRIGLYFGRDLRSFEAD